MGNDIVFWLHDLNLHLSGLISSLSKKKRVLVVTEVELSLDRVKDGWYVPDFANAIILFASRKDDIIQIVDSNTESVHIFLGVNAFHVPHMAMKYVQKRGLKNGVISESGIKMGLMGYVRRCKSLYSYYLWGKNVDFLLTMGYLGQDWFKKSFYEESKLFPFTYVVQDKDYAAIPVNGFHVEEKTVRILVVAQCIKRKNIELLLLSLSALSGYNWMLQIVGNGVEKKHLEGISISLGLQDRVFFLGTVDNKKVRSLFDEVDLSILPSKWDGWGAVVNESLMAGVPVICSDTCGSACLLDGQTRGDVFKSDSKESLESVLLKWLDKGRLNKNTRQEISEWSDCISGESVSDYLLDILHFVYNKPQITKPVVCWSR